MEILNLSSTQLEKAPILTPSDALLRLLNSFGLNHKDTFLNNLDKNTGLAIYNFYGEDVELHVEAHGCRFVDVLKVVLNLCPEDEPNRNPTFEGTLRANFIEQARPVLDDCRIFSEAEAKGLRPLIAPLRRKPYETTPRETPSHQSSFDELCKRYPKDSNSLQKALNGSCCAVQQLYDGITTPLKVDFYNVMMVVLEQCPITEKNENTINAELRSFFVSLFYQYKDSVTWELGQKERIESLLSTQDKKTNWTPALIIAGLFVTFLTYRYVAQPLYQWIRRPNADLQQKV